MCRASYFVANDNFQTVENGVLKLVQSDSNWDEGFIVLCWFVLKYWGELWSKSL